MAEASTGTAAFVVRDQVPLCTIVRDDTIALFLVKSLCASRTCTVAYVPVAVLSFFQMCAVDRVVYLKTIIVEQRIQYQSKL